MMILRALRKHLTPPMVVALVALVVSVSGTAYAAAKITGANIKDGSIKSPDIGDGAVQAKDIKNGTLAISDLSPAARNGLDGAPGPRGPAGPPGTPGTPGAPGAPGGTNVYVNHEQDFIPIGGDVEVAAYCEAGLGERALGGGASITPADSNDPLFVNRPGKLMIEFPSGNVFAGELSDGEVANAWTARALNTSAGQKLIEVWVICTKG